MSQIWVRTCQECLHIQVANPPREGEMTTAYANAKCRKCKSEALDYGRWEGDNEEDEEMNNDGKGE